MCRASRRLVAAAGTLAAAIASTAVAADAAPAACARPLYLTFDTGHMGVAPLVAEVLKREQVPATFFLANEPTKDGGSSLDDHWAPWWRALASQGVHQFGTHTWNHQVWLADAQGGGFRMRATALPGTPVRTLSAGEYCEELKRPAQRLQEMTGQRMAALFRAPAGKTSTALLQAAQRCGFAHVGWSAAGFLGDELPSERYPNDRLLAKALRDLRPGDVLLAHLGIWSRQDPWAPAVLEPLISGLKARGFCFETLAHHPAYAAAGPAPL